MTSTFHELILVIRTYGFDLMALSKTWLKDNHQLLSHVFIPGYVHEFSNRDHILIWPNFSRPRMVCKGGKHAVRTYHLQGRHSHFDRGHKRRLVATKYHLSTPVLSMFNLTQYEQKPTRITPTSETLTDHIVSNNPKRVTPAYWCSTMSK